MPGRIINKKQYIVVRAVWLFGRPAPAASVSINGVGVGSFVCPAATLNSCTTPTAGSALLDAYNHADAPPAENIARGGVSNVSSCFASSGFGICQYSCLAKSTRVFSGLPYLNTRSDGNIVVNFNWASGGCCYPSCCRRTPTSTCAAWNSTILFVVGYRWGGEGSTSATYTPLLEWVFTNMSTYSIGCSTGTNNLAIVGGQCIGGGLTGCVSFNPDRPQNGGLVSHGITCPTCN